INDVTAKRGDVSEVKSVEVAEFGQQPPQQTTPGQTQTPPFTPAPSVNAPQPQQTPQPGANARPLTPEAQTQQSVQPAPQGPQQPSNPNASQSSAQPQAPVNPQGAEPAPATSPQGSQITPLQGPPPPGRESVPTAAPGELPLDVPQVAPNYNSQPAPYPELGRVGVDMTEQHPLALREAIELALKNSKDIEVARENVRAAEFDLLGAHGAYDPRFSSLSYYERTVTPSSSFLSGGPNGAVTQSDFTGTFRFEGLTPKGGGGYRVD